MRTLSILLILLPAISCQAQSLIGVTLPAPNKERGLTVMQALALRASATDMDTSMLSVNDISDLLWATVGINREESGKRTAPTALNAQEINLYLCSAEGIFLYLPKEHALKLIVTGDHRKEVAGRQEKAAEAPIFLILTADLRRFPFGDDERRKLWAAMDAGIASQNISIFCAGTGLSTRPRATMNSETLHELMMLDEKEILMLNHPVCN
jgi:SagB-type dehydrogenase family enzyme